jgi:hypothetical protein
MPRDNLRVVLSLRCKAIRRHCRKPYISGDKSAAPRR